MSINYSQMSDEDLVKAYNDGDKGAMEYLCTKYKPLVLRHSAPLFLIGAETEDLIQEGMLGLFKAIQDYEQGHSASFFTFASLCIQRQMLKAIEASGRQKNQPLNAYVSLSPDDDGNMDPQVAASMADPGINPEALLIAREEIGGRIEQVEKLLSPMEKDVFRLFLAGNNYRAIAGIMGKSEKSVDNALTRIRLKAIGGKK